MSRVESSLLILTNSYQEPCFPGCARAEGRKAWSLLSAHGGSSILGECWSQQNVFPAGVMKMLETEEPAPGPVGLSEPASHLMAEQWLPGGQRGRARPGQGKHPA